MTDFEVRLSRDDGTMLALLDDWESLDYTLVVGDVGTCRITLPGTWDISLFPPDHKIEVWRKPTGGAMALERAFLITIISQNTDDQGVKRIVLDGEDGNCLLKRRIVPYNIGTTGSRITAKADSIMKDIVRDNLSTGATDTTRRLSTGYFTVETKSSAGPNIVKEASKREVLAVCQELSAASKSTGGVGVFFDVCSPTPEMYQFRTYLGQIGMDHSYPSGVNAVLLGLEYSNLSGPSLTADYSQEANVIYGGGLYMVQDSVRSGRSMWGRKEVYASPGAAAGTTALQDEARVALDAGRPTIRFEGQIVDSPGTVYGTQWRWGDRVTALYANQSYNASLNVVHVQRSASAETVDVVVEFEEASSS